MNTWNPQANEIFLHALGLGSAAERREYIDAACAGDESLWADVEALLAAGDNAGSFLESPAVARELAATLDRPIVERPGTVIGRYKLLEQIGEGGFGIVFMAEQQEPVRRKVALKVLRPGMDTRQVVARFEAERQALALMAHPNIAQVFDGGTTHMGRPYFVMELVRGVPITEFCDERSQTIRERLDLFVDVCQAVQHAHQKGIIHRDIKPSNVLVTLHGGKPVVKVIDFGIAKALGQQLTEKTLFTNFAQMIGTPLYMSPEQAQMNGLDIDTRSDIYSLGVLFYELLTGTTPFERERLNQVGYDEMRRIIREEEPARPSTRISTIGRAATTACQKRQGDARKLSRLFRGELDSIVMKCLENEAARRYPSVEALADDLKSWFKGEPIKARSTGPWERGLKWLRRHPAPAAITLITAVAVLAIFVALVGRSYNAQLQLVNDRLEVAADNLQKSLGALKSQKEEADRQRTRAKDAESTARRILYAAQMAQAEQARQQQRPDQVLQILRSVIPDDPKQDDPRGWEWHHLWRLYHGEESCLRGHKGAVTAVAFSPDDRLLASGGDDATIRFWDVVTGKEHLTMKAHASRVTGLSFSPKGQRLASASADGTVKIWDTEAGRELLSLTGHQAAVNSIAFNSDDRHVASGSDDKTVRIWDINSGQAVKTRTFASPVSGVDFSPDGQQIACACLTNEGDHTLPTSPIVWQAFTGAELRTGRAALSAVAFRPDGKAIATAAAAGTPSNEVRRPRVTLWGGANELDSQPFAEHDTTITRLAFSPDGKWLASASLDQTLKVWDVAAHEEIRIFQEQAGAYSLAFSPDGLRLASGSGDGNVRIWSLPGAAARTVQTGPANNVVFSPDGKRFATGSEQATAIWDTCTGLELLRLAHDNHHSTMRRYARAQWSHDGRFIASLSEVWDATTGAVHVRIPEIGSASVFKVAFTADATRLAAANLTHPAKDGNVRVFDTGSGQLRKTFSIRYWPTCVAVSPDDMWLAAGSGRPGRHNSGGIKVWNLASGKPGVSLEDAFYLSVWDVAFSPDGKWLAAAIGDYQHPMEANLVRGEVIVWDAETGVALHRLRGCKACVWSVAFSPDGNRLAAASSAWGKGNVTGGEIKIWDLSTGQNVCNLQGHAGPIYGVAYSPCGRRIATASHDGTVKIWDGTPLAETPDPDGQPIDPFDRRTTRKPSSGQQLPSADTNAN